MRILPVLDLQAGSVVRGIGGRRHEYRPITSNLAASARSSDVALAFRTHLGLTELYVADLDAIAGSPPALATYAELNALGFHLWVDAGLNEPEKATPLLAAGVQKLVFGLETLAGPNELADACQRFGSRVVFSLDLKNGEPMGHRSAWGDGDAWSIAEQAVGAGADKLIVLDLARVGIGNGTGTETLCSRIAETFPSVEVIAGGGVRGVEDLRRLKARGVRGVLIASALHDGRLRREQLAEFTP